MYNACSLSALVLKGKVRESKAVWIAYFMWVSCLIFSRSPFRLTNESWNFFRSFSFRTIDLLFFWSSSEFDGLDCLGSLCGLACGSSLDVEELLLLVFLDDVFVVWLPALSITVHDC